MRRAAFVLILAIVGLLGGSGTAAAAPVPVVASFSILADFVRAVGGDRVQVTSLVGPGGDVHVYQPSPADALALRNAKLLVINGLGLEGWTLRLEAASGFAGRMIVASDGIAPLAHASGIDPHAWQEVENARIYVRNIAQALIAIDPEGATAYRAASDAYLGELAALDRWVRDRIAAVPPERRVVVSTHDAFAYFARAYGVRFLAPIGMTEESDPSAAAVADLIRLIRRDQIRAVFLENMSDPRLIRRLADEAGVTPSGTLYADALSAPGGEAATYLDLVRHNVEVMTSAMDGQ